MAFFTRFKTHHYSGYISFYTPFKIHYLLELVRTWQGISMSII